ncbi:sensor histidine kinase [Virgisporangium aurantiacum]|uniref:Signal transduction histidine kinase n=1 Tax=Virgisporangium aurantiacum TaxID=175570 RepID=A0A8J3Z362_9ACTN|nr:histidine kinase [Virgisporangium aurantiacum]GIJ56749.1 hypothetical protein Vau01_042650 [Virgisporangium aurantiacum]
MADVGTRPELTPDRAWAIPTAFLCLLLPARAGVAVGYGNGATGVCATVALFALPLMYTVPRGRVIWERHPWWLLSAQAVLTYAPFAVWGRTWVVGLSGLLAGLVLLTVRTPLSWWLFVTIVAVEGVLRIGVFDLYPASELQYYSWVFVVPIDMALPLFGLVRLSDLVSDLHATRSELAGAVVTQERLRTSARLRAAVGDRLEIVTAHSRATIAALSHSPDRVHPHLVMAAGVARQAAEQVRLTVDEEQRAPDRPAPRRTGSTVAPRLAVLVLVVDLSVFAIHHAMIVVDAPTGPAQTVAAVGAIAAIVALQLRHSLARRGGGRPAGWRVTLPVQALLPFTDFVHATLLGLPGFPAGSALLLLRGRRAWVAFTAIGCSMATYWLLRHPEDLGGVVYLAGLSASTGLAVYGLSRLRDLAEELAVARQRLVRAAVEQERLRVSQDTHDLLGLSLSAIALKCDLAGRLAGRDNARTRAELHAVLRLAAQAQADIRAVTTGRHGLTLRTELAAARDVLATADVRVRLPPAETGVPLPSDVEAVLATVLREAVTNVLRHSKATRCDIELTARAAVTLRVTNDGADGSPRPTEQAGGGHGLTNLTARIAYHGGTLTTRAADGRFALTAHIPLPAVESDGVVGKDPLTRGDPTHRGDDAVGGTVLGDEP